MVTISQAILSLQPMSQFVITGDDYLTIVWHELEGDAPTLAQVKAEMKRLTDLESSAESGKVAAKASALSKLAALGLTEDEAKAIIG